MKSIQTKLLVYITLICVVPMLVSGFFYYRNLADKTIERVTHDSLTTLERFDKRINIKNNRVQNIADILFNDYEFQKLLRNMNLHNLNEDNKDKIDLMLQKIFKLERELETVVLFSKSGGSYVTGKPLTEKEPFRFMMQYGRLEEASNVISWLGVKSGFSNNVENKNVLAGFVLRDNNYLKDQQYIASIYLIFSNSFFDSNGETQLPERKNNEVGSDNYILSGEKIYMYDNAVKLLYKSQGANDDNILMNISLDDTKKIYAAKEGSLEVNVDGERMMLVFYTSSISDWKYVGVLPHSEYAYLFVEIVWIVTIALLLIIAAWYVLNYFVVRKITMPLKKIAQAMQQVGNEGVEVALAINSKDEIGVISTQFNAMTARIKELLLRTKEEEQKRKESDILMLKYQINPHFLYNTLAAIRMEAIINKQDGIAQMILLLGKFLKNIVNCTDVVPVLDEVNNIKDYILLFQIRHKNQIKTQIKFDEAVSECLIPGMLVQPIIENAIMHGLNEKFDSDESAELKVDFKKQDGSLIVSVVDNGCGIDESEIIKIKENIAEEPIAKKERGFSIGLSNIHKRITMMFGCDYGVSIKSEKGKFTEVNIKLPIMKK